MKLSENVTGMKWINTDEFAHVGPFLSGHALHLGPKYGIFCPKICLEIVAIPKKCAKLLRTDLRTFRPSKSENDCKIVARVC